MLPTLTSLINRFTPTCVGNTCGIRSTTMRSPVHPHVCGEYFNDLPVAAAGHRFTPTCVGNTRRVMNSPRSVPVHPHVCGEYSGQHFSLTFLFGSPPRVWGIRFATPANICRPRFTPTCVGNTMNSRNRVKTKLGSPPRVWEIRTCGCNGEDSQRFTPTCVGNTDVIFVLLSAVSVHPHVCGEYNGFC